MPPDTNTVSPLLHYAEILHDIALVTMVVVYSLRLMWLFKFKGAKERQAPTGSLDTNRLRGSIYSLFNIAMPWAMESTRKHPLFYLQFVVFHIGVVAGISLAFILSMFPNLLKNVPELVLAFQISTGAACAVGVLRMFRRISQPVMRLISTPDDYFSLALLTVWFANAVLAAPEAAAGYGTFVMAYYFMTAFFLFYVPFSKISHYLYYPFSRWWIGRTLGHRGVYPLKASVKPVAPAKIPQLELSEQKES